MITHRLHEVPYGTVRTLLGKYRLFATKCGIKDTAYLNYTTVNSEVNCKRCLKALDKENNSLMNGIPKHSYSG